MKKNTIFLVTFLIATMGKAQVTSTFAGSTQGFTDGIGTAAQFYLPTGIATDATGNVYVADTNNNLIRKITSEGVVTTFAGSTQGFADGTSTAAKFFLPHGVATDTAGNVYVADSENHKIRKITPSGVVTTLAGSTQGDVDGTGAAAKFNAPYGVATDAAGNVYVGDYNNYKIRKITPSGVVTTLAKNIQNIVTIVSFPRGLVVDAAGNVYVAFWGTDVIGKITPTGTVTTLAGSEDNHGYVNATGTAAKFYGPSGITIDPQGNLYVADQFNNSIRKITPAGAVTTLAGSINGTFGYQDGTTALFYQPLGIAADAFGNLFIGDGANNKIRKISNAFLSVSLNDLEDDELKVYPNPIRDILNFSFNKKIISISIYNLVGQEVLTQSINDLKGSVDVSSLVSGTYVAKLSTANKTVKTVKIVKK